MFSIIGQNLKQSMYHLKKDKHQVDGYQTGMETVMLKLSMQNNEKSIKIEK